MLWNMPEYGLDKCLGMNNGDHQAVHWPSEVVSPLLHWAQFWLSIQRAQLAPQVILAHEPN